MTRRARIRRLAAKRPPDADVRIVPAPDADDRSDLVAAILVRWLDERTARGGN